MRTHARGEAIDGSPHVPLPDGVTITAIPGFQIHMP